jgi:hypothetical protein
VDWGLLATSIGLVIATVGLVVVTKRMADEASLTRAEMKAARDEMEVSRRLSVRPHLHLGVAVLAPLYGVLTIHNIGPGAALDVSLEISYEPGGFKRAWKWPVMTAGDVHEFILPGDNGQLENAVGNNFVARAKGTYKDIYGESFTVKAEHDFAAWWRVASQSDRRFAEAPTQEIAKWVEKIARSVEKMAKVAR